MPDVNLATVTLPTVDLGGEIATVLDGLPGQDINRRILTVHGDRVINIMIARIGPDYGTIGEKAEALSSTITDSFAFIEMVPDARLMAGRNVLHPRRAWPSVYAYLHSRRSVRR